MNMRISSTYFQRRSSRKATWSPPGGGKKCQIDHILIDNRHASNILNVRSFRYTQADIEHHDSDHYAVGAKIRFRLSNIGRIRSTKQKKYDVTKLKNNRVKENFNARVEQQLKERNGELTIWQDCHIAMKQAAEECLGYHQPEKKEWFDDECKQAVQRLIEAKNMRTTRARTEEIKQLQRNKKELFRSKKRKFDRQCLDDIEELQSMNESRKFFNAVKFARKKFHPRVAICKSKNGELLCSQTKVLDRWKEHFQEVLNVGEACQESRTTRLYERNDGKECPEPTLSEVREAIARLKNNKAPGEDSLPAELFKTGCSMLEEKMHEIIVQVWNEEKMPDEWTVGVICPLHKKGYDIDIVGRNLRSITDAYSKLEREAERIGLKVNEEKTKLLMVAASDRTKQKVGSHLSVNGRRFEVVQDFKYLGSFINTTADVSMETLVLIT
ncbi:uncharacterized protein [Chironomus tepperi]|uniref:uncharacterized protein n=1 Tax=Chironomus tepperi TaxID=113505 RepID=UPI00391F3E2F